MTLPAKNRKRITFKSGHFHYIFSPNKSLDRARLLVESDKAQSPLLIVQWIGLLEPKRDVIPRRFIRAAIDYAMELDWLTDSASQFEIGCDATEEELQFTKRPAGSKNDWFLKSFSMLDEKSEGDQ